MSKRKVHSRHGAIVDMAVPCGNPKRLQTGQAINMSGTPLLLKMAVSETLETEGDRQLKAMAQKQMKKDITIKDLFAEKRQFCEAGLYKPATMAVSGVLNLQDYAAVAAVDSRLEVLRQCGLTDDEVRLCLTTEGVAGCHQIQNSAMKINPDIGREQLQAIDAKLRDKEKLLMQPDAFRGVQELTRQQADIEKSLFRGTERERSVVSGLLTRQKPVQSGDSNDPINCLPQIVADIETRAREKIKQKRRPRKKNVKQTEQNRESLDTLSLETSGVLSVAGSFIGCLTWEDTATLQQVQSESVQREVHVSASAVSEDSCINQTEDNTVTDNQKENDSKQKVVERHIPPLPQDYIVENRLSMDEICCLPKFQNYEAGRPGKVLYVKNLAPCTCEADLVALFGRYQKQGGAPVIYRLMKGRMRGQAFITFEDVQTATDALNLVNGYKLHGKPVVIQYGRQASSLGGEDFA